MSLQIDDDAFLRGVLVSMGAQFDEATVDCLRQVAHEQFLDVVGTARRIAAHTGATVVGPDAAAASCQLHMMSSAPMRERLLDAARLMNGRNHAWPLTSDVLVPVDAVPAQTVATLTRGGAESAPAVPVGAPRRAAARGKTGIKLKGAEERTAAAAGGAGAGGVEGVMALDDPASAAAGGWVGR